MQRAIIARFDSAIFCSRPVSEDDVMTELISLASQGIDPRDMKDVLAGTMEGEDHYLITSDGTMVWGPFTLSEVAEARSEALANWPTVDVFHTLLSSYNEVFGRH